jgi:hypothetical protein
MRTIRASELGTYRFCRRSWGFQLQGRPSENQAEMSAGSSFHHRHGRQVVLSGLVRVLAWIILLAAVMLIAAGLTLQWVR